MHLTHSDEALILSHSDADLGLAEAGKTQPPKSILQTLEGNWLSTSNVTMACPILPVVQASEYPLLIANASGLQCLIANGTSLFTLGTETRQEFFMRSFANPWCCFQLWNAYVSAFPATSTDISLVKCETASSHTEATTYRTGAINPLVAHKLWKSMACQLGNLLVVNSRKSSTVETSTSNANQKICNRLPVFRATHWWSLTLIPIFCKWALAQTFLPFKLIWTTSSASDVEASAVSSAEPALSTCRPFLLCVWQTLKKTDKDCSLEQTVPNGRP